MRFDVLSLFPELIAQVGAYGVTGRAAARDLLILHSWNPRDDARAVDANRHASVDDRPYGGGPGMVLQAPVLRACLQRARAGGAAGPVLALSPQGARFDQAWARRLAGEGAAILLCGRYEGIDERFMAREVDAEISIGDFVLSGGELPAMLVIDAVARLLPGALGDAGSAAEDSFAAGLLDHPHYTRPPDDAGDTVPAVLLSGDHAAIARWRLKQALGRTWLRRPDLLDAFSLDAEARELLAEFVSECQHGNT